MKPLWVNRAGTILSGALENKTGKVVAFDSELDEAILRLDENTFVKVSSEMIWQEGE